MLASRGWGAEDFLRASPEFLAACRWLVMSERMVPEYQQWVAIAATVPPKGKGWAEAQRGRLAAQKVVDSWKPYLFPDDG